jgi:guanosine-3',5'-bis(diphosphate) 3'-pyrophosphohydrolase
MEGYIEEKKKVQQVIKAKEFASDAHEGQLYGEFPYTKHLNIVASLVESYGYDAQMIAHLHDIIEDTSVTADKLKNIFGSFVSECVELLTDPPGKNRKERKKLLHKRLSELDQSKNIVLIVKTADRLSNVAMCIAQKNIELFKMYQREYNEFKNAVYRDGLCEQLWQLLENAMTYSFESKEEKI